jgi:leader peptidase (prepilin peptidase)/N-methyltransferase
MLTVIYALILVFVFAVGAVVGRFLNVVIYRLPLGLDFVRGSSFCPKCEHKLGPLDLVPIFSYLFLGRKCRYCGDPISPRYMIVEMIGGCAALLAYLAFLPPWGWLAGDAAGFSALNAGAAGVYFFVLALLICVTFIDADTMEIPNSLSIWLAVAGVALIWLVPQVGWVDRLIGVVVVSLPMFLLAFFIPGSFGLGDVKLIAAAGLVLGWQGTLEAAAVALLLGGGWAIFLLVSKLNTRKGHFAFGPALCAGITVALLDGGALAQWYIGLLGIG